MTCYGNWTQMSRQGHGAGAREESAEWGRLRGVSCFVRSGAKTLEGRCTPGAVNQPLLTALASMWLSWMLPPTSSPHGLRDAVGSVMQWPPIRPIATPWRP